jgi:hypothetical protein
MKFKNFGIKRPISCDSQTRSTIFVFSTWKQNFSSQFFDLEVTFSYFWLTIQNTTTSQARSLFRVAGVFISFSGRAAAAAAVAYYFYCCCCCTRRTASPSPEA